MGHKILTVPYLIFPPDTQNNMNHAGPVNQITGELLWSTKSCRCNLFVFNNVPMFELLHTC